jgi:hypothetical protein
MTTMPMRSRPRRHRAQTLTASLLVTGALLVAGCVGSGDVAGPPDGGGSTSVRASIAARLQVDAPAGALLRLTPAYLRQDGTTRDLPTVTAPLGTAVEEQVAVEIEFGACLADAERAGWQGAPPTAGECVLLLRFALLVENAQVDTATIGPMVIRGGQRVIPGAVSLQEAAALQLFTADGTPLSATTPLPVQVGERRALVARIVDGAGRSRPARGVTWRLTPPGLATVSDSGVLAGVLPGVGSVGAASGGVEVAYPVRIIRAPAPLRIEGAPGSTGRVVVTSRPAGIQCAITNGTATGSCELPFPGDTTVTLEVVPEGNTEFRGYDGACVGDGACALPMTEARTVRVASTARFTLAVAATGGGSGVVTSVPDGIRCTITNGLAADAGCSALFRLGTAVELLVTPGTNADFTGWSGDCTGTGRCQLPMTSAAGVTVSLVPRQPLSVSGTGSGTGVVTSSPAGIRCVITSGVAADEGCAASFPRGSTVTLTATASAGSDFAGWQGACTGAGSCTVAVDAATAVTARLALRRTLTVTHTGVGNATITSTPGGIQCVVANGVRGSIGCSAAFPEGTVVTLAATAGATTDVVAWSGACSGSGAVPCSVTMSEARAVALALAVQPLLSVTPAGTGDGTITSSPAGIACTVQGGRVSGSCAARFAAGTVVALTTTPSGPTEFVGWGGACAGSGSCAVTLTQDREVTATLTLFPLLTVAMAGNGEGVVTSTPEPIGCQLSQEGGYQGSEAGPFITGTCTARFPRGTVVTLTQEAGEGSTFGGWEGACTGAATCTVTLTDDRTVTASFGRAAGTFRLTVEANVANTGSGTVFSGQQEISCTITQQTAGTCSADFLRGTEVTLTPVAGAQSSFDGWGGACSGFQSCTVTLNEDLTVSARFFRATGIRLPGGTPTRPPAPQKPPLTVRTPRPPAR